MTDRGGIFESLGGFFVPIHRDGHKFVAIGAVVSLLMLLLWAPLGWLAVFATIWVAYFFRDPDRVTPLREGLVVAPADGEIVQIEQVTPPSELALSEGEWLRVSIALSPFDVHVNRAPVPGRIVRSVYVPGAFINPTLDKASEENERRGLVIETSDGTQIAVVQIAGQVSRRIVTFAHEGDSVGVGQRFGLIRFGSRVDVYLPPGGRAQAGIQQRVVAGETVLADLQSEEPEREYRRS